MWAHTFTVFTATYNRRHTLGAVFESLLAQTYRDFEWLIVDDGSTDGTKDLVESWMRQAWFPIRYFYQSNGGKHVAFNRGVREARGELLTNLDSDDTCVPEALARFYYHWNRIPQAVRHRFSGVVGLCLDENGHHVGKVFPRDVLDSDSLEIQYRYKVPGEKWGAHRTEVLRQFPFPEGPDIFFVPESVVWGAVARHYKTRYVNEGLRVYRNNYEGNEEQLSRAPISPRGAAGMVSWHVEVLNKEIDWFWHDPSFFLRSAIHYVRFSLHAGVGPRPQIDRLGRLASLMLVGIAWPLGWGMYCLDIRRLRYKHA